MTVVKSIRTSTFGFAAAADKPGRQSVSINDTDTQERVKQEGKGMGQGLTITATVAIGAERLPVGGPEMKSVLLVPLDCSIRDHENGAALHPAVSKCHETTSSNEVRPRSRSLNRHRSRIRFGQGF